MLSANVLCMKMRKKKSYSFVSYGSDKSTQRVIKPNANGAAVMLQITEDTPPDMLAGAMDLIVHLPNGRQVKMSIERRTPMLDLLVQITNKHHLQLSSYTLQPHAIVSLPSSSSSSLTHNINDISECDGKILPYKPNTPIGTLDTKHVKVVPRPKSINSTTNRYAGGDVIGVNQPFESTFRLKVHLPRNQLYVARVSQSLHLEDIMRKVCDEKNLDAVKYEFRHPENLDDKLNPKLCLSDYQITEVYIVAKGSGSLNQTFSTSDIMALRKEELRKQMHNKTGGGVFNLIFRRGKSSSGSVSSENCSISPTQSDDSRSVTPPAPPQQLITPSNTVPERPKRQQRKRQPAPKPPVVVQNQPPTTNNEDTVAKNNDSIEKIEEKLEQTTGKTKGTTLTIYHSRNSSDSSGYHEASILSDQGNMSLPRRPKSELHQVENLTDNFTSLSTSNLSKLSAKSISKSTSSLALPSRKKKVAPPPPQSILATTTTTTTSNTTTVQTNGVICNFDTISSLTPKEEIPSPPDVTVDVVASQSDKSHLVNDNTDSEKHGSELEFNQIIKPEPRKRTKSSSKYKNSSAHPDDKMESDCVSTKELPKISGSNHPKSIKMTHSIDRPKELINTNTFNEMIERVIMDESQGELKQQAETNGNKRIDREPNEIAIMEEIKAIDNQSGQINSEESRNLPEIVAMIPKNDSIQSLYKSKYESFSKSKGFKIGSSLIEENQEDTSINNSPSLSSVQSALNAFNFVNDFDNIDMELFTETKNKKFGSGLTLKEVHEMHEIERGFSVTSLRSFDSGPGLLKKWTNKDMLDLDLLPNDKQNWVIGDTSDTESLNSPTDESIQFSIPIVTTPEGASTVKISSDEEKSLINEKSIQEPYQKEPELPEPDELPVEINRSLEIDFESDLETDWKYELPSPPKAFRDLSPVELAETESVDIVDSVVTSPELFEALCSIKKKEDTLVFDDVTSVISEEEKPLLNTLSLENLDRRKSLVYNRELTTSIKMCDEEQQSETFNSSLIKFENTYDEIRKSSQIEKNTEPVVIKSTLPNFKITTYDQPKQKLNIFEDDTIRSNNNDNRFNSCIDIRRTSDDDSLKRNFHHDRFGNYTKHEKQTNFVNRSESFSTDWSPSKPVTRSKSQVAINKYQLPLKRQDTPEDALSKTNSLFDVSGLQSLEVMRLIQTKLRTPTNSVEEIDKANINYDYNHDHNVSEEPRIEKPFKTGVQHTFRPVVPSINLGTWSERPKVSVNEKKNSDFRFNYNKFNNTTNTFSNNSNNKPNLETKTSHLYSKSSFKNGESGLNVNLKNPSIEKTNVTIKINGSEPISAKNSGNVLIKIGEEQQSQNKQHMNVIYRKPFNTINTNEPRPHTVEISNDFDISRVPIVRSVELKKPYKDLQNKTVTQIRAANNNDDKIETVQKTNSYHQTYQMPVVRGFDNNRWKTNNSGLTTLPKQQSLTTPMPFSHMTLRKTDSNRSNLSRAHSISVPPAPPEMPKLVAVGSRKQKTLPPPQADPRDQLLQAIRDFGGKKGFNSKFNNKNS